MKLQDFRKLIREMVEMELEEKKKAPERTLEKDELGKFYIVVKTTSEDSDPVMTVNLLDFAQKIKSGEIPLEKLDSVFSKSGSARKRANEILKVVKQERKDLEEEMEKIRELRRQESEMKQSAKSKVNKLKGA
jgi:hypothetical protein